LLTKQYIGNSIQQGQTVDNFGQTEAGKRQSRRTV